MDAVTLDRLLAEIRPMVLGRHLRHAKTAGAHALVVEVSGRAGLRLWLDLSRQAAGIYLLEPDEATRVSALATGEPSGRARQARLLFRKHLDGARVSGLFRVPGERAVVIELAEASLALRLRGSAPALTLAIEGVAVATMGDGGDAWPPLSPRPDAEWNAVAPDVLAVAGTQAAEGEGTRAVLAVCPSLGPLLAREVGRDVESVEALRARLRSPRPTLLSVAPLEDCTDADLAAPDSVVLAPVPLARPGRYTRHPRTWREAAAAYLEARYRGARFQALSDRARSALTREEGRLARLEAHLREDRAGLPPSADLRRQAEALLASSGPLPAGARVAEVLDPYHPGTRLRITVDPSLSAPGNAERLFDKARRIERALARVDERFAHTCKRLDEVRNRLADIARARTIATLQVLTPAVAAKDRERGAARGVRQYLSSRGLAILVGRGARENHRLTFSVAGPEDHWLHASDVPGAHVILRDPERRARAEDLREAAELAAFFSDARENPQVDVQVARRKHVRAVPGSPGRVRVTDARTLRVRPRDPEGRLRRR